LKMNNILFDITKNNIIRTFKRFITTCTNCNRGIALFKQKKMKFTYRAMFIGMVYMFFIFCIAMMMRLMMSSNKMYILNNCWKKEQQEGNKRQYVFFLFIHN